MIHGKGLKGGFVPSADIRVRHRVLNTLGLNIILMKDEMP